MNLADYARNDALGLAELVRSGQVSARELLETASSAIAVVDPKLEFLVADTYDFAGDFIAAGLPAGPFTGVPFLKKDLGQGCRGIACDWGCSLGEGFTPDADSSLYARIKEAGLVIVGRSAVPSFGLSSTTEPPHRPPTRNPWDTGRSCGGSSGGAAAAVASGAVPIAHASDGGGSIRIPAAACGLVGHKPTRGLLPCGPAAAELVGGFAVDGVVTRTVRDTAAFLDAVAGPDPGCRYFTPPPDRPLLSTLDEAPARLRIALNLTSPAGVPVDPACRRAAEAAADLLDAEGHHVEPLFPFPDEIDTGAAGGIIWGAHLTTTIRRVAGLTGREVTPETVGHAVYRYAEACSEFTALEYAAAGETINEFSRAFGRFFESWDLLLEPASAIPAPPLGFVPDNDPDVTEESWVAAVVQMNGFTIRANKAGLPAVTVPWDVTDDGLPVGVQLMGAFGADALCLRMARLIELARPWSRRRPRVHVGSR